MHGIKGRVRVLVTASKIHKGCSLHGGTLECLSVLLALNYMLHVDLKKLQSRHVEVKEVRTWRSAIVTLGADLDF